MVSIGNDKNKWKVQPDTTVQVVEPMGHKQENDETNKNWSGICISLAIITVVGILIAIATFLVFPLKAPPFSGRRLVPEDLSDPQMRAAPVCSQWLSASEVAFFSEESDLVLLDIETNNLRQLVSNLTLHHIRAVEFSISSDRRYALLEHDVIEGRLFKKLSRYTIYDLQKNYYYPLKLIAKDLEHPRYQHAVWFQSLPRENGSSEIIIIHENNLVFLPKPRGTGRRLTTQGKQNNSYFGVPDDMYEEILRSRSSIWPNEDGDNLAFISFNDSLVKELPIINYEGETAKAFNLKHATVESPIPKALVWVLNIRTGSLWSLTPLPPIAKEEHYVLGVGWVNKTQLWVSWVSRDQSTFLLATCSGANWTCSKVHVNHFEGGISPTVETVVWSELWSAFPWPIHINEALWHNHVAMVGLKGAHYPALQLRGCHVAKVLAATSDKIYFLGSEIHKGTEKRHLYLLNIENESLHCISCIIECPRVSAKLNPSLSHSVVTCIKNSFPSMYIVALDGENSTVMPLHQQTVLRDLMVDIALPVSIYQDVVLSPSVHASIDLSLPPGWIENDESFLYSLVIHVLGVENYDEIDVEYRLGLSQLLSSGSHVAYAKIRLWRNSQYMSTKTMTSNIIKVIRKLLEDHEYLDEHHISLWGWGSGASLALQLSTMKDPSFKCVLAINPVTDWRHYGSYWAERFLGSLNTPEAGRRYEESNMMRNVKSFSPGLMVMTSGQDPMSHHSAFLTKALIQNQVHFQQMVYPDSSLSLRKERGHVLNTMQRFFVRDECAQRFHEEL